MQWYILQVYSGNEKKIERELLAQIEKKNMQNNIEKILIPSEEVIEMKKGKKVNVERKFFPGYMLMKMKMDDEIWHIVRTLPKVYGFLGGKKGEPIPVSQSEIDSILNQMKDGLEKPKPSVSFVQFRLTESVELQLPQIKAMVRRLASR